MTVKVGMLFPDYASQYVGMAKELYDNSRLVQEYFEEASNCLNINFIRLCFASSDNELSKISHAYPSLFLVSSAIAALLRERGVVPYKVAGYNYGEYAALCSVGSLTLPDGLYFLSKFACLYQNLLQKLSVRTIKVTGISASTLQSVLEKNNFEVVIASYDFDDVHTFTGLRPSIAALEAALSKIANATVETVPFEAGLHSAFMIPVATSLKMYGEKIDVHNARSLFVSGVDGASKTEGRCIKENLIQQISSPVLWKNVMHDMQDCDVFVHIGPGNSLAALTKNFYHDKPVFTVNKQSDVDKLINYLGH